MSTPAPFHHDAPLMLSVSGCRGVVGASLTPEVVVRFAGAFAGWVGEARGTDRPVVVVARDGRRGGDLTHDLAVAGLRAAGCRVIDLGIATTPTTGVMVLELGADAGLVVTASHNPAEWNGLKPITAAGRAPGPDESAQVIARFREGAVRLAAHDKIDSREANATAAERHVERVIAALGALTPLEKIRACRFRVVVDSVNCSGAGVMARLLGALGCRVTPMNNGSDGVFPHPPEPIAENLGSVCGRVLEADAQIGLAQDPDADRLAIVDAKGRCIGEEYTLALAAMSLLDMMGRAARGAIVAANLSTSRMIDDAAAEYGARVVRTPVGEANVVRGMAEEGAVLGGEGNGGVIWPEVVPIRDSVGAAALVLALMARTGRSVEDLCRALPSYAMVKRKVELRPGLSERALARIVDAFPDARRDEQDGVRVDFDAPSGSGRAWLHVRPSNTEPILRLIVEAPTQADADSIIDEALHSVG